MHVRRLGQFRQRHGVGPIPDPERHLLETREMNLSGGTSLVLIVTASATVRDDLSYLGAELAVVAFFKELVLQRGRQPFEEIPWERQRVVALLGGSILDPE